MGFLTSSLANPPQTTPQQQQQPPLGFAQAVQAKNGSLPVQHFDQGGVAQNMTSNGGSSQLSSGAGQLGSGYAGLYDPNPLNAPGHVADVGGGLVNTIGGGIKGVANALVTQNGYQAQLAPTQDMNYSGIIGQAGNNALQGYNQFGQNQQAQQGVANQLQSLAGQYGQQAMGQGPNPAQAQLAQNTGNNISSQAALMAGQRGASSNAGMIARQAGQQGAATQQQSVGQAATLQAQQSLAAQQGQASALGQLSGTYGQMGAQNIAQQQASAGLFGTGVSGNNTQNANTITNYGNAQGINSQVAQNNTNESNKATGGLLNNGISMISSLFADGGAVASPNVPNLMNNSNINPWAINQPSGGGGGGGKSGGGMGAMAAMLAQGGNVPTTKSNFHRYCKGGALNAEAYAAQGIKVPGKASVAGNSYSNDTVPAMLSPGEIIVPRDHANDPQKAAQFAYAVAMKNQRGGK